MTAQIRASDPRLHRILKYRYFRELVASVYSEAGIYRNSVHLELLIQQTRWFERNKRRLERPGQSLNLIDLGAFFGKMLDNAYLVVVGAVMLPVLNLWAPMVNYRRQYERVRDRGRNYTQDLMGAEVTPAAISVGHFVAPLVFIADFLFGYNLECTAISTIYSAVILGRSLLLLSLQVGLAPWAIALGSVVAIAKSMKEASASREDRGKAKYVTIVD